MRSTRYHYIKTFLLLTAIVIPLHSIHAQDFQLSVKSEFLLTEKSDGFEGKLQLLEDSRINDELQEKLWFMGEPDNVFEKDDPRIKDFKNNPLMNAQLLLLDEDGKLRATQIFEHPLAKISPDQLHPGHRTFLLTVDYSAGFGSYSGPITSFLEIDSWGRFNWIQSQDAFTHEPSSISMMNSLKSDWKLTKSRNGAKELFEVYCRPDWNQLASATEQQRFFTYYVHYRWSKRGWEFKFYKKVKFWEADEFPPESAFPQFNSPG